MLQGKVENGREVSATIDDYYKCASGTARKAAENFRLSGFYRMA